jgi:hypothetical protein
MALFTLLPAPLLYFRPLDFRDERLRVAIGPPGKWSENKSYEL